MSIQKLLGRIFILIFIPILLPLSQVRANDSATTSVLGASPAAIDSPAESNPAGSNLHTIQIRVKGSLCPACLKQLQKRLSAKDGITDVTVKSYALEHYGQDDKSLSSEYKHSANYTISFDPAKISQSAIEEEFKSDYFRIAEIHPKSDIHPKKN